MAECPDEKVVARATTDEKALLERWQEGQRFTDDFSVSVSNPRRRNRVFEYQDILLLFNILRIGVARCKFKKGGDSLAVRLPASVVEVLGLKEGDEIEIHVVDTRALEIKKTPGARELLARVRKYRGRLPADFKFDRLEAHERG